MLKWVVAFLAAIAIQVTAGAVAEAADVSRSGAILVGVISGILFADVCRALWPD